MFNNQKGQGLVEYLIIVAIVGATCIGVTSVMSETIRRHFASVTKLLQGKDHEARAIKSELPGVDQRYYRRRDLGNFMNSGARGFRSESSSDGDGE